MTTRPLLACLLLAFAASLDALAACEQRTQPRGKSTSVRLAAPVAKLLASESELLERVEEFEASGGGGFWFQAKPLRGALHSSRPAWYYQVTILPGSTSPPRGFDFAATGEGVESACEILAAGALLLVSDQLDDLGAAAVSIGEKESVRIFGTRASRHTPIVMSAGAKPKTLIHELQHWKDLNDARFLGELRREVTLIGSLSDEERSTLDTFVHEQRAYAAMERAEKEGRILLSGQFPGGGSWSEPSSRVVFQFREVFLRARALIKRLSEGSLASCLKALSTLRKFGIQSDDLEISAHRIGSGEGFYADWPSCDGS